MEYELAKAADIDAEEIVRGATSLRDLLGIDFPTAEGKIYLLRRQIELLANELAQANDRIERLERR